MSDLMRMRAKFVTIQVASGRGVAERWAGQYRERDGSWRYGPEREQIYNRLVALGENPPIDKVAEIIGNKSWSYIRCDGCNGDVERAVAIGEYDTKAYCATCIREAYAVLTDVEPAAITAEMAESLSKRAT